jgi:preprotein translocase subunit SecD
VTASVGLGDTAYRNAGTFAFLANTGAVDATLTTSATGDVPASSGIVLTVFVILCAALLVCSLIYLVAIGKLTGVSAFIAVWCTVVLVLFFMATVVVPSSTMLHVASLVAVLLGVLLSMYSAVTRTDAISKQIGEGSTPKQATKLGMKNAAKTVWIAHCAVVVIALILMIFAFSRSIGYTLFAGALASALSTLVMRAFQLCFTAISSKPALFGKVK